MIIVFSWISLLILLWLGYIHITKQTEKYAYFVLIGMFFVLLFAVLDYQTSMIRNDIVDFYSTSERVEICNFTTIYSECYTDETNNYDISNEYVAQYYALRDLQFEITGLVSTISIGVFGVLSIMLLIHYVKKWGLVK